MVVIDPSGKVIYNGAIDDHPTTDIADVKVSKNYLSAALAESMSGHAVRDTLHAALRVLGEVRAVDPAIDHAVHFRCNPYVTTVDSLPSVHSLCSTGHSAPTRTAPTRSTFGATIRKCSGSVAGSSGSTANRPAARPRSSSRRGEGCRSGSSRLSRSTRQGGITIPPLPTPPRYCARKRIRRSLPRR